MNCLIGKALHFIAALIHFIRFSAMSFSILLPLLGAATAKMKLAHYQILGLVGTAITFHVFAYVLNDIVDLPLDCTQDLRAQSPLVKGTIHSWQALVVVLAQIPLALTLSYWIKANYIAYVVLGAAFICMTIYNLWGKLTSFPPLTDCIQGVGWGALVLYGAILHSDHLNALTDVLFLFVVIYILLINGIHGGLRDLANDAQQGVRTTAILLGAKPVQDGGIMLSPSVCLYALLLQVLLSGIILLPLVYNWFSYGSLILHLTLGIVSLFLLISLGLLFIATTLIADRSRLISIGTLQIVTSLSSLLFLFIPYLDSRLLVAVLMTYTIPLSSLSTVWRWLRRNVGRWISIGISG